MHFRLNDIFSIHILSQGWPVFIVPPSFFSLNCYWGFVTKLLGESRLHTVEHASYCFRKCIFVVPCFYHLLTMGSFETSFVSLFTSFMLGHSFTFLVLWQWRPRGRRKKRGSHLDYKASLTHCFLCLQRSSSLFWLASSSHPFKSQFWFLCLIINYFT